MPDGTPGRLLGERLAPPADLVGTPGLFCPPLRFGEAERTGPLTRLLPPGRFCPCILRFANPPRLAPCRFGLPGRAGATPVRLLEPGRFDNP